MNNLKEGKGTYKGLIGECMFKMTRPYLIVTKFFNKRKYFEIFGNKFSKFENEFIDKNWFSIDAIEINYSIKPRKVVIYEIKTVNEYKNPNLHWGIKMTLSTHKIYNEALKLGFDVKFAIVHLLDNWNYEIEIVDFDKLDYYIDKPKPYDKNVATF
jgi:hypothetical protein